MHRILVVMAKTPVAAVPSLDMRTAVQLHEDKIFDVLEKASAVPDSKLVVYTPADTLSYFRDIALNADACLSQEGENTRDRIRHCFETLGESGRSVVLIRDDIPSFPIRSLELAFDVLASGEVDVVFGPAEYLNWYLVGMNAYHPGLLQNIDWDAPGAIEIGIENAANLGLGWYLLPNCLAIQGIR